MDQHNVIPVSKPSGITKLALALVVVASAPVLAADYECQSTDERRDIRLEIPGREHLCEVTVTKDDNNREVKWYANQNTLFCSEKLVELKNKHIKDWGFTCTAYPDQLGIQSLTKRQRIVLDAELKRLIQIGEKAEEPFVIGGLKAVSNQAADSSSSTMVFQYFIADILTGNQQDITQIIIDNGLTWRTLSQIDNIANFVDVQEGYRVNGAMVAAVTDAGALDIITDIDITNTTTQLALLGSDDPNLNAQCFGSLQLKPRPGGRLEPSTPHRLTCQTIGNPANDAG